MEEQERIIENAKQEIWSWGAGTEGQLGTKKQEDEHQPQLIHSLASFGPIFSISCGGAHVIAITHGGRVLTWGRGTSGQLGHGEMCNSLQPKLVESLQSLVITHVSAGWNHSGFVSDTGCLFTCGDGSFGQLGHGDFSSQCIPTKISYFNTRQVLQIACGMRHSLALLKGFPSLVHYLKSGCATMFILSLYPFSEVLSYESDELLESPRFYYWPPPIFFYTHVLLLYLSNNNTPPKTGDNSSKPEATAPLANTSNTPINIYSQDNSNLKITNYILNGYNYLEWQRSVQIVVKGMGKYGYLIGAIAEPKIDDPRHQVWDAENFMVIGWLINSMEPKMNKKYMYFQTAKQIWDGTKKMYSEKTSLKYLKLGENSKI
ncbi:guanyl-nucleotide exchange factor [Lithospermum erythrorhizon]|uniref:Guanyl-nucleotide exchange factor n=1 Tax=Lithospermum erythrorhizon TaxID=34254 RepID=A0AAV3NSJ6_LITER